MVLLIIIAILIVVMVFHFEFDIMKNAIISEIEECKVEKASRSLDDYYNV